MRSNRKLFWASVESLIRSLVVLAFLTTQCRPVWAGSNTWTRVGPNGASLATVAIDPQNPSTVYAANSGYFSPEPAQVFKSTDGGANWVARSALPVPNQRFRTIEALAINPKNPNTIYAYGRGGVFKSTDSGETWVDTEFPASVRTPAFDPHEVTTLAIDPQNSEVLYAGTFVCSGICGGRVFKSTDAGHTWITPTFLFTDPACSQSISALVVDPQNPRTLYATTTDCNDQGGDLFKSTDGGTTWKKTILHVFTYYEAENVIAIDPQNPNRIYVGTGYGIATSTDGGESWNQLKFLENSYPPEQQFLVTSFVIDQNPRTLYAAGYSPSAYPLVLSGIFKSVDGGTHWMPFGDGLSGLYIRSLVLTPSGPRILYAGTSGGVFKILDNTPILSLDSAQYCIGGSWDLKVSNGRTHRYVC
jgi:photosystem II stability/assembly factor-like uncharacterized protein